MTTLVAHWCASVFFHTCLSHLPAFLGVGSSRDPPNPNGSNEILGVFADRREE